jgi:hypothetical protein
MSSEFYSNLFIMYFFLSIPLLVLSVFTMFDIIKSRIRVRRCFKCGYIGRMQPYLVKIEPLLITIALLCVGVIPGILNLNRLKNKHICVSCGKIANHMSVSGSLTNNIYR